MGPTVTFGVEGDHDATTRPFRVDTEQPDRRRVAGFDRRRLRETERHRSVRVVGPRGHRPTRVDPHLVVVGDVVAIEPFATDGGGKVQEGSEEEIFALEREASVRNRQARKALSQITDEFKTLPFAARWLNTDRAKMALRRLKRQDIVHGYPVLKEDDGCLVSQKEHTVIVTEDGCEVTTRSR